jgi:hypothetical protein
MNANAKANPRFCPPNNPSFSCSGYSISIIHAVCQLGRHHREIGKKFSSYLAVGDSGGYTDNSQLVITFFFISAFCLLSQNLPVFFLPKHCTLGTEAMMCRMALVGVEKECAGGWVRRGVGKLSSSQGYISRGVRFEMGRIRADKLA